MGWDAYAKYRPHCTKEEALSDVFSPYPDPVLRQISPPAVEELKDWAGTRGCNISIGELGGVHSPFFHATPIACYEKDSEEGVIFWTPEIVQNAWTQSRWWFPLDDDEFEFCRSGDILDEFGFHILWETRVFLKTCAENSLSILFTF